MRIIAPAVKTKDKVNEPPPQSDFSEGISGHRKAIALETESDLTNFAAHARLASIRLARGPDPRLQDELITARHAKREA